MIQRSTLALGVCVALLGGGSVAHAHDVALEGDIEIPEGSDAYVSAGGEAVRTGGGECLRLGGFSEENQVNACEGIEDVEEVAEVEPEPAPAPVEPEPEPEPVARLELKEMDDRANFEFDSADLTPEGQQEVESLLEELADLESVTAINVVGYTDSTGPEDYNMELSERRAQSVAEVFAARYPDASVTTEGRGESNPIATNETSEGRQMNRRVDIEISGQTMMFE